MLSCRQNWIVSSNFSSQKIFIKESSFTMSHIPEEIGIFTVFTENVSNKFTVICQEWCNLMNKVYWFRLHHSHQLMSKEKVKIKLYFPINKMEYCPQNPLPKWYSSRSHHLSCSVYLRRLTSLLRMLVINWM